MSCGNGCCLSERGADHVLVSAVGDLSTGPVLLEGRTGDWVAWSGPAADAVGVGDVGVRPGGDGGKIKNAYFP
jgi:hypothetical protein